MRLLAAGDSAVLAEVDSLDDALALHAAIEAARLPGVIETIPAARTVLIHFRRGATSAGELARRLRALRIDAAGATATQRIEVPVHYDGEDLVEVAALLDVSVDGLIERHLAATWRVAFVGFAPGFAYMPGNDPLLNVPRRATPRTRIPAGAVAMAGRYSGVYPRESPGGWQLFGRTEVPMWDLDREPPALLQPGATVQFTRAERSTVTLAAEPAAASPAPVEAVSDAAPYLDVVRPGLQALVQDLGRPGNAHLGVSASGAVDRRAMRAVNRAVGNASDAVVLEIAGGSAEFLAHGTHLVAIDGAVADASIETPEGNRVPLARGHAAILDDGDRLRIGATMKGIRVYLGIRGGIDAPRVLGSASTDTLAGLGPAPIRAGDRIRPHATFGDAHAVALSEVALPEPPAAGEEVRLDVVLGPRADWFTEAAVAALESQQWLVTPSSDRVGLRLEGATPLERSRHDELESEGAVTGAIQVPPSGQPVLFLADHPLTGGYPIIGAVASHHLDVLGQLPPGARIRFHLISRDADVDVAPTDLGRSS